MKKLILLFAILVFIVVVIWGVHNLKVNKVNMEFAEEADVYFVYGASEIAKCLEDEELEAIKSIFNDKKMYKDNPSCGFSESISIKFNNEQTFCIARDTCPIVYWKEKDRYFKLTEDEKTQLYDLLEPYGFIFPCV